MSLSIAENRDCIEAMQSFPDGFFDLAVVDPPYGGAVQPPPTHTHTRAADSAADPQSLKLRKEEDGAGGLTATISAVRTGGGWFARKYNPG